MQPDDDDLNPFGSAVAVSLALVAALVVVMTALSVTVALLWKALSW